MDLGLDGKVALVCGGSSGIGLAVAMELAAEGAHVAIGARDPQRLKTARAGIEAVARGRVSATSVDITDADAVERWVAEVVAEFGALHIVLVNGGSPPFGTASAFGVDAYRRAVDTVLLPAVSIAMATLPHLRAACWGRLLFVASETACVPVPSLALSGVTRVALVRFAQGLAADVGRDGITVNVLAPGWTRTPPVERVAAARIGIATSEPCGGSESIGDGQPGSEPGSGSGAFDTTSAFGAISALDATSALAATSAVEAELAAMGQHNAVGRIAEPAEVAAVAAFLASERASFLTGRVHLIDGGASVVGTAQPH